MRNRVTRPFVFDRTALIVVAVVIALAASSALGLSALAGQAAATQKPGTKVAFEVASVKLFEQGGQVKPGMFQNFGPPCGFRGLQIEPKRINVNAFTYTLIQIAYGEKGSNCRTPELLTGGPEWVRSDWYDIEAVLPEGTPTYTLPQFAQRDTPQIQQMLQTLLAERFKLKVHKEMREVAGYVLTAGNKPKLQAAGESDPAPRALQSLQENGNQYGRMVLGKASMADLANMLSQILRVPQVIDKTGIAGLYNMTIEFDNNGVARPTVATALQEIGLKVESTKIMKEGLVIDAIERPTAN